MLANVVVNRYQPQGYPVYDNTGYSSNGALAYYAAPALTAPALTAPGVTAPAPVYEQVGRVITDAVNNTAPIVSETITIIHLSLFTL